MVRNNKTKVFAYLCIIQLLLHLSSPRPDSYLSSITDSNSLDLTILHVNDIHCFFDPVNAYMGRCNEDQDKKGQCFGGAGRMVTKVKELRGKDPTKTLFLNAGDYFVGTVYYALFKHSVVTDFANILNYTAFGAGNHDFDDSSKGLIPFVDGVKFPTLAANLDASSIPTLNISKSFTFEIEGHKIGIIGYITKKTPLISSPEKELKFLDEIPAVKEEASRLKANGVNILIALGHAGYDLDKEMASKIPDLDLIVGGHSHTFLWTGNDYPSVEKPLGKYPTFIKADGTDKIIPVVQAYKYGKYLGHLKLSFDVNGDLKSPVDGVGVNYAKPILLDNSIKQDEEALAISRKYRNMTIMTEYTEVIGQNLRILKGDRNIYAESNIGNFIADAFLDSWQGDADMAFINSGGIRSVLVEGDITGEDIFNILPFNNTIDRVRMKGRDIKSTLEATVYKLCPNMNRTSYVSIWQVSKGVKLVFHVQSHNQGHRIQEFKIPCKKEESITFWCELEEEKEYNIIVPSYFVTRFLKGNVTNHEIGIGDYEAFKQYVIKKEPLDEKLDGVFRRIQILWDNSSDVTQVTEIENTPITSELTSFLKDVVDGNSNESPYVWKNDASYICLSHVNFVAIAIVLILKLDL